MIEERVYRPNIFGQVKYQWRSRSG